MTETMSSDEVRQRELRPLQKIQDNYEKMILTMDKSYIRSYDGIKVLSYDLFLGNRVVQGWEPGNSTLSKIPISYNDCPRRPSENDISWI